MMDEATPVKKILCVCENGNNRSVQFAHLLRYKYRPSDTIPVGTSMHSKETLDMLYDWADIIIVVEDKLVHKIPDEFMDKVKIWHVGEDHYPRPFNTELLVKARKLIEDNPL